MHICIINEFFYPDNTGGTGTVLSTLAQNLHTMFGVEIDVITSRNHYRSEGEPLPERENWNGIRITRLNTPRPNTRSLGRRVVANLQFTQAAYRHLQRSPRYDAIVVGTAPPPSPLAAMRYQSRTQTPFLYITYDLEPDRAITLGIFSGKHPLARLLTRVQNRWLHSAGRVIVLGRCMRQHIARQYHLPPDRIEIIPIGFDTEVVTPASKQTEFRAQNNLNGFVALYAGNFGRYHNFDTLLDAAKALRTQNPDISFALVGQGAQRSHIMERIKREQIDNVRVFPFVPLEDFSDMLASADVCLVTLEKGMEGLCVPSKLYSNMAAGRPTVGLVEADSEVGYVLKEFNCGVQIAPGDTKGLIQSMLDLAGDPERAERMGDNARRALEEHFSAQRIAIQYYDVLQSITGAEKPMGLPELAVVSTSLRPVVSPSTSSTSVSATISHAETVSSLRDQ